ncbi:D-glycero-beta-D-manno-heptose 1,7-bisphosphate 7-phosphatase [Massilia sp. UBA6681]|uniref:D-glycero-beta-D-manno-heptose 1,7-bisphosphate 7-phosphatase n=1 Tax=Massilia sp. UBA6681 TaxID=1946839 RepID=UPI0025C58B1C|nr:D-glycero-beta-D-manno-heptose 1,7-bisphosphate 7-phosphatase [Massilia sp. UBA6681]
MVKRCVFLDRDGVINVEKNYLYRVADFEFVDGVPDAIRRLNEAGWQVVVVTNQSGIGRGYYTESDYAILTDHISAKLADAGATVDAFYHCPHAPDWNAPHGCECRKPMPGMVLKAASDLGLDLAGSVLVGDKVSDVIAGRNAGVGECFLVESGHALGDDAGMADGVFVSLGAFVDHLLQRAGQADKQISPFYLT